MEGYFWMLGVYFEPQYSFGREILTKVTAIMSIMDDIYDSYGTIEELQLLTNVIQRWDVDCINQLPDYLKLFYKSLLDVYKEVEEAMAKQGQSYRIKYTINKFKQLSANYFAEVKWYHKNYIPTIEEYMEVGLTSAATSVLNVTSLVGMEDALTPEIFNWAFNNPKIIVVGSIHARLFDDMYGKI
ncbi:hypothetical protein V6N12_035622 [Hibiscus sabdariffa]|uniref:Terpene synthase metal-binding domain-containing protein n=1 Tax=Hibiscus sabdariffa TaxID=183260 RepID=A0ABR2ES51_9ROSI